jgi:hypothetical protein
MESVRQTTGEAASTPASTSTERAEDSAARPPSRSSRPMDGADGCGGTTLVIARRPCGALRRCEARWTRAGPGAARTRC